jgi:hypothetical protein
MSQQHFGRPLARETGGSLAGALALLLAVSAGLLGLALVVGAVVVGVSPGFGSGAAFCVAGVAVVLGVGGGRFLARRLLARHEQRLGRRYDKTVGEPEKVVWLGAPGP